MIYFRIYDPARPNELAVIYRLENLQEKHDGVYKYVSKSKTPPQAMIKLLFS